MRAVTRRDRGDSGATAIIVALLVTTFLIGMSALSIDVGSLFVERRELQNGADAGALAVAKSCLSANCDTTKAQTYANANAKDGVSALDTSNGPSVCGTFPSLPSCPAPNGPQAAVYDCAPLPAAGVKYVQVRTSTLRTGGSTLMPPILGRAILGNRGYSGTRVHACSRAAAAAANEGEGFAATISKCEWQAKTANGTSFAPLPPYPPNPAASVEVNLQLHDAHATSSTNPCPTGYGAGADLPGGFGWLDDGTGTCTAFINTADTYGAAPGTSVSGSCKSLLDTAIANHTVLYMPVYDQDMGTGQNGSYHLAGFAAFVPTGYNLPGSGNPKVKSWLTNTFCYDALHATSQLKCLSGFFTQGLLPAGSFSGGGGSLNGVSVLTLIR